jgi:hypothetical protein
MARAPVSVGNQLRSELERFWPGPIGVFCDLDRPISLLFLERIPAPGRRSGTGREALAALLKAHRYNNRTAAAQPLERLRCASGG